MRREKNIAVSRRATVYDNRGNPYNIDVYYEFDVAGVHHRVAIECKDTRRPVERDDVIAFAGKIRDMPSTIGVFISNGGFQPAAKKYLDDHGILAFAGEDMPHFGSVLASMISPILFPAESAVGQPFWTLMDFNGDNTTGTWMLIPHPSNASKTLFPLFYAKSHGALCHRLAFNDSPDICVRGVEQSMLRVMLVWADQDGKDFAIMQPFEDDGRHKFTFEVWTPRKLAQDYVAHDPDSLFEEAERAVQRARSRRRSMLRFRK